MIRVNTRRLLLLAGVWMVAWTGCMTDVPPAELGPVGSARVVFVLPRTVPEGTVARVVATASHEGSTVSTELAGSGTEWQGSLGSMSPGQQYLFRAEALDAAGTRRFEAEVGSDLIEPNRPALIILVGEEPGGLPPSGNRAPSIQAVVASRVAVAPEGTLRLKALARDLDAGEELSYTWQADEGTFDDAHAESATWTAPTSISQRLVTLVVRDSHRGATSLTFTLDVSAVGTLSDRSEAVLDRWPEAVNVAISPSKTLGLGQEVSLELQGAGDPDGDLLSYTWTSTCAASQTGSTGPTFRFTPRAPESETCDNCLVYVRVEDGQGGSATYGVGLCVRNQPPPTILSPSPSALSAIPGELLSLSVSADDPSGGALTFDWKANTGTLGTPVQTGDTSEVPWTALSCVPAGVKPTIEVTVTNSAGLSVRSRYVVTWNGPACGPAPCDVQLAQQLLTLRADCATATPVFIPDGLMLDGTGRMIMAVDPAGGHFVGAILRNRGATADVRNLKVRAQGLLSDGPCDGGDDRLRGILLLDASGSVMDSEVSGIRRNQRVAGNPEGTPRGCQEGHAIEVRNRNASVQQQVALQRNQVSGYQKVGIVVAGRVVATVADNTVTGSGPVAHIAQNGVQLSDGATGEVTGNQISGHSYTGGTDVASGIIVAGGPYFGIALVRDALIQGNTLTGNDVGIYLDQAEADGSGPATPTQLRVLGNTLRSDAVTNGYPYQAGISDLGGGNIIHSNTITGVGYDPSTQPGVTFDVDVVAGPASQVAFLTPTSTVGMGACSGKVVVQGQDARGNLSKPTPATFTLSASGAAAAGLTFHADAGCSGPAISSVALSTPEAAGTFYFKATQPGSVTLSVSNGGLSGSQGHTISGT